MKSANQSCRTLEPEKPFLTSSPFFQAFLKRIDLQNQLLLHGENPVLKIYSLQGFILKLLTGVLKLIFHILELRFKRSDFIQCYDISRHGCIYCKRFHSSDTTFNLTVSMEQCEMHHNFNQRLNGLCTVSSMNVYGRLKQR